MSLSSHGHNFSLLKVFTLGLLLNFTVGCGSNSGTDSLTGSAASSDLTTSDSVLAQAAEAITTTEAEEEILARGVRNGPPPRPFVLTEIRTVDGTDNNQADPTRGAAETAFFEDTSRAYEDGIGTPSGSTRPNPRDISNAVVAQSEDTPDPGGRTAYLWLWGQFLDHDITLTHENGLNDFPISIPTGDIYFDPYGTGTQTLPFSRSTFLDGTGVTADSPRAQVNSITTFVDASNVYGSDDERAAALRTFEDGLLATSEGDLLPYNTEGLENAGGTADSLFLAGDIRANENVLLTCMHTVFMREHNRIARRLKQRFPSLSDEELYQGARKRVGAIAQVITYNEYIPALLGRNALPPYRGYKPQVDPQVGVLFATAAYRLGHSQVGTTVPRLDENGEEIPEGNLSVADAFFNPGLVGETGIDVLLRGAATEPAQKTDAMVIDDLRNFLFGPPGSGGLDLPSLNIQRGRDHGLPDYNTVRTEAGLPAANSFADVTGDGNAQQALASVYSGPDEVDPWVGLLSEDAVAGGVTGPTLRRILSQQFRRMRDGDRFFYLNDPDLASERDELNNTTLAQVIERNTDIRGLQRNVFFGPGQGRHPKPKKRQQYRRIPHPSI